MSMDNHLREQLIEEAQSARLGLDVDAIVTRGRRERGRRRAALVGGVALGVGLLGITVWQIPLLAETAIPVGTDTAEPTSGDDQADVEPSPGDPAYVWPVEGSHNTQMDWWNSPGLERYDEVAADHPQILVIDTVIMAVIEDNQLSPTFETRIPTTPVPIDPEWPAGSIVIVDAGTFEVIDTANAEVLPEAEVYWPLPPNPDPLPEDETARWANAVPGYDLGATSVDPYGEVGTQMLLYQDDTSLTVVVAVTTGVGLQLQDLSLRIEPDELNPIDMPNMADARWGQDEYGVVLAGVNATETCAVRVWHQQTAEPVITPDPEGVEDLVFNLAPEMAALACG